VVKFLRLDCWKVPSFVVEALSWMSPVLMALVCIGYVMSLLSRILSLSGRDFWSAAWRAFEATISRGLDPSQQEAVIVGGILFLLISFAISKRLGIALGFACFIPLGTLGLLYAVFSFFVSSRAISLGEVISIILLTGLSILYALYLVLKAFLLSDLFTLALLVSLANVFGFAAAWLDSVQAVKGGPRIPEGRFLFYAILGGGCGVIAGAFLSRNDKVAASFLIKLVAYTCISYALLLSIFGLLPG